MKTARGKWYCKEDNKGIAYLCYADTNYPERHAYGLIQKLQDHLSKIDYEKEEDINLTFHVKGSMGSFID